MALVLCDWKYVLVLVCLCMWEYRSWSNRNSTQTREIRIIMSILKIGRPLDLYDRWLTNSFEILHTLLVRVSVARACLYMAYILGAWGAIDFSQFWRGTLQSIIGCERIRHVTACTSGEGVSYFTYMLATYILLRLIFVIFKAIVEISASF